MFGFEKQKRENYSNTFLRKVILNIEYSKINTIKEHSEDVKMLFSEVFPRFHLGKDKNFQLFLGKNINTDLRSVSEDDSILLKSLDNKKELHILCDKIVLSIDGDDYVSFEEAIKPIIETLEKCFALLKINTIFNCSIRKINLVEFGYGDNNFPNGILETLLNNKLVNSDVAFPNANQITMNIRNINFMEDNYLLNLKYGMNTLLSLKEKIGQLIVDLTITNNDHIDVNGLEGETIVLNDEIFNVFYWIFNDKAKKILKNEHVK